MKQISYLKYIGAAAFALLMSCSDGENELDMPEVPEVPASKPDPEDKPGEAVIPAHDFPMGALFSFQKNLRNGVDAAKGGTPSTTFYNRPLFEAKEFGASDEDWWDSLVEEMVYSGLDYVLPNCRRQTLTRNTSLTTSPCRWKRTRSTSRSMKWERD